MTTPAMITLGAEGITLAFDADIGMIADLTVSDGGQEVAPLHRAPWVGTGEALPEGIAPHMARLGGDFFCAPFGGSEGGSPLHGWPANAPWQVGTAAGGTLRATLTRPVMGATVRKELSLHPGHPFVYQRHVFHGGAGRLPVANHANISLPHGGLIRTSAKSVWMTPPDPQESDPARGRSGLRYPAESDDPARFPGIEGTADLTRYPWFPRHEDFVAGVEAEGHALGWTAVTRPEEGDLFLSLRDARALPMTMLWHSDGGRDYAPWSGRHLACLGVEEGVAAPILGADRAPRVPGPGVVRLSPGAEVTVTHAIGAIAWPSGAAVRDVALRGDHLRIEGENGTTRDVPFAAAALGLS